MEEMAMLAREIKVGDELWWASGWRRVTQTDPGRLMIVLTLEHLDAPVSIGNDETRRVKRSLQTEPDKLLSWLRAHSVNANDLTVSEVGMFVRKFLRLNTAILAGDFPEAWKPEGRTDIERLKDGLAQTNALNATQRNKIRDLEYQLRQEQKRYSDSLETGARLLREKETLRVSLDGALASNAALRSTPPVADSAFRTDIEHAAVSVAALAEQVGMVQEDIEAALSRSKEKE